MILIIALIGSLGKFILSILESFKLETVFPLIAACATSTTLSIEFGPITLAREFTDFTNLSSAAGKQPAIIKGLFVLVRYLIRCIILCSVEFFTEQVTIKLILEFSGFSAILNPWSFNCPAIISKSAKLAEQPYPSIQKLGFG